MKIPAIKITLLLCLALLSGCATAQTSKSLSSAKHAYEVLSEGSIPEYTLQHPKKKKSGSAPILAAIEEKIESLCGKPLRKDFFRMMERSIVSSEHNMPPTAGALNKEIDGQFNTFKACTKKESGLIAHVSIKGPDEKSIPTKQWAKQFSSKLKDYSTIEAKAKLERQAASAKVGQIVVATVVVAAVVVVAAAAANGAGSHPNNYASRSYNGNCQYSWQRAADGSVCGNRAASVRPGGR